MGKSWKVLFAFAGIYFAGAVTGILVAPRIFRHVVERRIQQGGPARGGIQGQQIWMQPMRRFTDPLDLTPEQQKKIKPIEARMAEELRRLRRETQDSTKLVFERAQLEIAAELTPEQRERFDEQIAKGRERMKNFLREQEQAGRKGREGNLLNGPGEQPPPRK
jgi:hypothetical protein